MILRVWRSPCPLASRLATMPASPEKLDLASLDVAADKRRLLQQLFPEAITESVDETGRDQLAVDFERLKAVLGEHVELATPGQERYGLEWPGKRDALKAVQASSLATLIPAPEESVDWDTTQNVFIEGDNLEVLKLLQKSYYGKVKMIYIDPPYNTGNDFVYPDNYAESLDTYLRYTGQIDDQGFKTTTNSKDSGRFHSNWLRMMYPRLYVAKNLLREDGVIFISIDDNEVSNLRHMCDQILGEENFVVSLFWEKGRKNDAKLFSSGHDYILVYAKSKGLLAEQGIRWREAKPGAEEIHHEYLKLRSIYGDSNDQVQAGLREFYSNLEKSHPSKKLTRYGNVDDNGIWRDDNMSWPGGGGPDYPVIHPVTKLPCKVPEGGWRYSTLAKMNKMIAAGRVQFRADHTEPPIRKTYLVRNNEDDLESSDDADDDVGIQVAGSYFYRSALQASNLMIELFGVKIFDYPKDHEVLARWVAYITGSTRDGIILDFFSGSATTAHAVMALNAEDRGTRRCISIQLPEPTDVSSEAAKAGFKTIADIAKERIRRAGAKIRGEWEEKNASREAAKARSEEKKSGDLFSESKSLRDFAPSRESSSSSLPPDTGFRVFKLAPSNFKRWDGEAAAASKEALVQQMEATLDHIATGATAESLLFEILLKAGYQLTCPMEKLTLAGHTVWSVDGGSLLVCVEDRINAALIDAVAEKHPVQFICLDRALQGNDPLKVNTLETFRAAQPEIQFRTV